MYSKSGFKLSPVAMALSVALASFSALADEVDEMINPNQKEISVSVGHASNVDGLYRQYSGVVRSGSIGSFGLKLINRDDEGRWLRLEGVNLGTKNQEFSVSAEKQGDWILSANYDELNRYNYLDIQSNNTGIGSTAVWAGAGALDNIPTLGTKRESLSMLGTKFFGSSTKFTATVKSEEKTGLRLAGYNGYVFAPEPIAQTHTQYTATLEHSSDKFQVSAGYYGSSFKNAHDALRYNNSSFATTVSLPSDNFFYQLFLDGAYKFTDDTRGTLRISYSKATQDEVTQFFPVAVLRPAGGTANSLSGRVDNVEVFGSLSSKLTANTKLLATWKYEKKDDKTPYMWFHATDQDMRTRPESGHNNKGKLEISHNFGAGASLTGGYDYSQKRNTPKVTEWFEVYGRDEVVEHTVRMSARANLSDSVNGSLTVATSDRSGSTWIRPQLIAASTGGPVYPVQLADRVRDKVRGQLNWAVSDALEISGNVEGFVDDFTSNSWGIRKGSGMLLSLDGNYRIDDSWHLNAWFSDNSSKYDARSFGDVFNGAAIVTGTQWDSQRKYESQQLGLGLKGQVDKFLIGANYTYIHDVGMENISSVFGADNLPRTKYYQNSLRMFGEYVADKRTKVRLEYLVNNIQMDDYAWQAASAYVSNTTAYLKPKQTTHVIGVTLTQSF